jgi:hypothetical protein
MELDTEDVWPDLDWQLYLPNGPDFHTVKGTYHHVGSSYIYQVDFEEVKRGLRQYVKAGAVVNENSGDVVISVADCNIERLIMSPAVRTQLIVRKGDIIWGLNLAYQSLNLSTDVSCATCDSFSTFRRACRCVSESSIKDSSEILAGVLLNCSTTLYSLFLMYFRNCSTSS